MRQVIYAMQFEGHIEPAGDGIFRAVSRANSARITTTVGAQGFQSQHEVLDSGTAEFASEVRMIDETSFTETGRIEFGEGNSIGFSTIGEGHVDINPDDGSQHGAVLWRVESGEGQFEGASGIITSNVTVSAEGELTDHEFGVIWVD